MNKTNTINDHIPSDISNVVGVDSYKSTPTNINGNEWDYVYGFFKKSMVDPIAAEQFSQQIFQVSIQSGISVTEIVESMDGKTGLELSASLAYYLNGMRSNSSMIGVQNIIKPNYYAGRSVII